MKREGNLREADAAASGKDIMTDAAASGKGIMANAAASEKDIMTDAVLSETAILALMILAAVLLAICLVLLLVCLFKRQRRHRTALTFPGDITQELPVAEVQAALQTALEPMRILTDIVYCESEEIIP